MKARCEVHNDGLCRLFILLIHYISKQHVHQKYYDTRKNCLWAQLDKYWLQDIISSTFVNQHIYFAPFLHVLNKLFNENACSLH